MIPESSGFKMPDPKEVAANAEKLRAKLDQEAADAAERQDNTLAELKDKDVVDLEQWRKTKEDDHFEQRS